MTGSVQTRSMPQWNPHKSIYELPVLGGDPASQLHNLNGQSHAQWFQSKHGIQWTFGGVSSIEYFYEPPVRTHQPVSTHHLRFLRLSHCCVLLQYQAIIDTTDMASRMYKTVVPCVNTPPAVCGPHTSADGAYFRLF